MTRVRHPALRTGLFATGVLLIIAAPVVSPLPGPAGTLFFAGGLVLVLRNSAWARKRFAVWKRRWPRAGGMADWALRRPSAQRRRTRDRVSR